MSKIGCAFIVAALCCPALVNAQQPQTTGSMVVATGANCTTTTPTADLSGLVSGSTLTTGPCSTVRGEYFYQTFPSGQIPKIVTYIPQVVDGGVWKTTIVIANTTASAASAGLACVQETNAGDGSTQPWNPPFGGNLIAQNMSLAPGATIFLDTSGTNPTLSQGWCVMTASDGVQAHARFSLSLNNSQGSAPAAIAGTDILVPVDNANGGLTAVAVANPTSTSQVIAVSFQNTNGTISQANFTAPPNGHNTFLLPSLVQPSTGQRGLAEFIASGGASLIALQFNSTLNFTSAEAYPVANGPIVGAIDPITCAQNPLKSGCPNPPFSLLTLYADFAVNNSSAPLVINITPGPTNVGPTLYTAAISGSINGQPISGSFIDGTLSFPNNVVTFAFQTPGQFSTFSGGSLNFSIAEADFEAKIGEAVGALAGQLVLTQANVGGGTISGRFTEVTGIAAVPWLVDVQ